MTSPDFEKHPTSEPTAPEFPQPGPRPSYPPPPTQPVYPPQPAYGQPTYPGYGQPSYGQPVPPAYPPAAYGQPNYPGYAPNPALNAYGQPAVQKPMGWFIVNWLFFWPLAIYSLVSAWNNIDPALYSGNIAEAQRQCGRVRKFGIIALCVNLAFVAIYFIVVVAIIGAVATHTSCYTDSTGVTTCS